MISFAMLSALVRALFALWALLLCLVNMGSAVLAAVKKRLRFTAVALLLFVPTYFMWQVIFDLSLFGGTDKVMGVTATLCGISWGCWLAVFVLFTVAAALLLGFNIRYDRTFITPGTIKLYLDRIPCGICCWRKNGRVLFSNICMNELCVAITGNSLLNGNQFCDAVQEGIHTVDGKVWRFASREIIVDGETLFEMIASDITTEYARTAALEEDKAELSRLNEELREYYLSIDESVQRQEILQAKMNIHDEMNRLMLSTVAADREDTGALDNIFSLWEQNALLLCMEADKKSSQQQSGAIDLLAEALGINVVFEDEFPDGLSDKQRELFYFTAQEAIINAVKHAQAKEMRISFEQTEDILNCRFTNNGKTPEGEVRFEGGLANIALLAKKQDATIQIETNDTFSLILSIKNHPFG